MFKRFKLGFYGGKFLPFHNGHKFCINVASKQCDELHVIMFINGADEKKILSGEMIYDKNLLTVENRILALKNECKKYDNVKFSVLDCNIMNSFTPDGEEDWDAETEWVIKTVGYFDYVYSSEPSYDEYFSRAYPFAKHILIDPPRNIVPVSATMIRNMTVEEGLIYQ